MTTLKSDLVKRIDRLPKPTNVTSALQPLFEAVSNAIHSTQAKYGTLVSKKGQVTVTVSTDRKKEASEASVEDNGVGLDQANWDAFITTDTDNKLTIGGKGIGRLLWLDCFLGTRIDSVYGVDRSYMRRAFDFILAAEEQIQNLEVDPAAGAKDTYFRVQFGGGRRTGTCGHALSDDFVGRVRPICDDVLSAFSIAGLRRTLRSTGTKCARAVTPAESSPATTNVST